LSQHKYIVLDRDVCMRVFDQGWRDALASVENAIHTHAPESGFLFVLDLRSRHAVVAIEALIRSIEVADETAGARALEDLREARMARADALMSVIRQREMDDLPQEPRQDGPTRS